MTISFQCPGCPKKLKANDGQAGKRVKCPGCGRVIVVPAIDLPSQAKSTMRSAGVSPAGSKGKLGVPSRSDQHAGRVRWPWYVGGAVVALCVLTGLVVLYLTLAPGGNQVVVVPPPEPPDTGKTATTPDTGKPATTSDTGNDENKGDKGPGKDRILTASKASVVGICGDWEVQLVRLEFVNIARNRETRMEFPQGGGWVRHNPIFGLKGNKPSEWLLVCLCRVCLREIKFTSKNGWEKNSSFSVAGKAQSLHLCAVGEFGLEESKTEWEGSGGQLELGRPVDVGENVYKKGQQIIETAVIRLPDGEADRISREGIRIQVADFVPGHKFDLPLTIPGKPISPTTTP